MGGAEPFVEVEAALGARAAQLQHSGGQTGGDEHLDPVGRRGQEGPEGLVEGGVGDVEGLGVDHIFEVVEQDHRAPLGEGIEQGTHEGGGRLPGITVALAEPSGRVGAEQLAETGEQVGEGGGMVAHLAQVHDAVHLEVTEVVGQLPALEGLQQPAGHGGLAHAAPSDDGHQPQSVVAQEVAHETGLDAAALEPRRRGHRRLVDELRQAHCWRGGRLPLPLDLGLDPLRAPGLDGYGVVDQPLLLGDALLELADLGLDATPLVAGSPGKVPPGVGEPVAQLLEDPLGRVDPAQPPPQPCETLVEEPETDVLPGAQAQRHLDVVREPQGDHGLFVLERPNPFVLAGGAPGRGVRRHHEQHRTAGPDRIDDLVVPVLPSGLELSAIDPDGVRGRSDGQLVGEPQGELRPVNGRVAHEELIPHVASPDRPCRIAYSG